MDSLIGTVPWSDFSTGGLLGLVIVLIIRGDLIPRRTHEAMISDRDFWRTQFQNQQGINESLAESVRTSARVLEALPHIEEE